MKRGTIKAFREYLNTKFADGPMHRHVTASKVHYGQRVRPYGDYLYYQDRDKFNVELADALAGVEHGKALEGIA